MFVLFWQQLITNKPETDPGYFALRISEEHYKSLQDARSVACEWIPYERMLVTQSGRRNRA